jgi:hypothetical protein
MEDPVRLEIESVQNAKITLLSLLGSSKNSDIVYYLVQEASIKDAP